MRVKLPLHFAALVSACYLASCGASSEPHSGSGLPLRPGAENPGTQLARLLPAPAELDQLAGSGRSVSADNIQDGSAFFSAHPGVEVQGTQLRLEGGAGYEWAVYSFDPGASALLQVEVSQAVSAGSAYLAVPDYEAGRWALTGPHSGSVGSNLAYPGARNGAGVTYCAVIAPAGAINTIQTVNFITDAGGGTFPITVDAQDGTGWDPHAAIVQGRPAIAYADYGTSEGADGDLTYVIADDAQGSSWGEPLVVDSNGDTGHSPSMLIVDGNPAIAYHKFDEEILMYVRAADATGSSWGSPVIVDQSNSVGGYPHMELVAGRPAIIHLMWPLGDNPELMYVRADDSTGAAWPAGESLATFAVTEEVSDTWSMEVVNGNPAVAFSDSSSGPLFFRRASNAEGGAWNDAVQVSTGTIQWNDLHVDAGGNPCISFYDAFTGVLKYVRASDANGSAWGSAVVVDDRSNTGWFSDLVLFNGLPVIGYYSLLNGNLGFAMADDANGSVWSDLRTLDEAGNTGGIPTLLPLGDGSTLGVAYFDVDNQDLRWIGDIS